MKGVKALQYSGFLIHDPFLTSAENGTELEQQHSSFQVPGPIMPNLMQSPIWASSISRFRR